MVLLRAALHALKDDVQHTIGVQVEAACTCLTHYADIFPIVKLVINYSNKQNEHIPSIDKTTNFKSEARHERKLNILGLH